MRAVILVAAILLAPLSVAAQTGGDGSRGPRQPNAGYTSAEFGHSANQVRSARPAAGTATQQQARRRPATTRNRPATTPRAN